MIRNILLDLDDCLNMLSMPCLKHVGCPVSESNYSEFPSRFGYEIVAVANYFFGYEKYTVPEFWNLIDRRMWATFPKSPQFDLILSFAEAMVPKENICILTGPTKDPECLAGKYEWITTVLPPYLHRQYLIGPRKQFCAHPEALLIDDSDDNVKAFRGAGGHAILVPRPWNSLHALNTTEYLQREFGRYLDLQLS